MYRDFSSSLFYCGLSFRQSEATASTSGMRAAVYGTNFIALDPVNLQLTATNE